MQNIEKLQYEYDVVYVSKFSNTGSPLLSIMDWSGYDDETLAFTPQEDAIVFTKTGYTSYLSEMKAFDEIHLCGFDTEACVYKTALDLVETGVRPVVLKDYCYSSDEQMHIMSLRILEKNIGIRNLR